MNPKGVLLLAIIFASARAMTAWASPVLTTLTTFNNYYTVGAEPGYPSAALVADAAGNLYGTAYEGGAALDGTVFEVAAGTHALSALASFGDISTGAYPSGGVVIDTAGNLYGATQAGAAQNGFGVSNGEVFEVAAGTHAFSILANFNTANSAGPGALIVDGKGDLYGTTNSGGTGSDGTVFEVAAGTHTISTLANFSYTNGDFPTAGLVADAAGNLYGTTLYGGSGRSPGFGTVFEVTAGTHELLTLASFTTPTSTLSALTIDAAGNLYGTRTSSGGSGADGSVFEVAAGTYALSTIATFNGTNGRETESKLIIDAVGNMFGTTVYGGAENDGTVFEVASGTHAISTLATFSGTNGVSPYAGLMVDAAGNLYGTTTDGGPSNDGTVFEITGSGFVVPEPGTGSILLIASALSLTRRRRRDMPGSRR
jgi:uncharacterized repeat protein (TIGR03803 family)